MFFLRDILLHFLYMNNNNFLAIKYSYLQVYLLVSSLIQYHVNF